MNEATHTAETARPCTFCGEPLRPSDFGCECCPRCSHPAAEQAQVPDINVEPMVQAMFSDREAVITETQIRAVSEVYVGPLARVLALHHPDPSGEFCDHCWPGPTSRFIPASGTAMAECRWPCATVRALDVLTRPGQTGEDPS